MYDAYVRGVNVTEIAEQLRTTPAEVVAAIEAARAEMQARYPGTTAQEADELRAIYLLGASARKIYDNPGSVRIETDLLTRQRDIITTAAGRDHARQWREEQKP